MKYFKRRAMKYFKRRAMDFFVRLSGIRVLQNFLLANVKFSQFLIGIGCGGKVSRSGENIMFSILSEKCVPPYCIFDVGANKGQFMYNAINHISTDNFIIHCFEPGGKTFKDLTEITKDDRIILNNIGLGNKKESRTLYYNSAGSQLASLTKRRLVHHKIDFNESETVEIDTIDNYCTQNKIKNIHLLKIDIEGHELDALAGAKKMLDKNAVDIITFEFGGCNIDTHTYFQNFWYFFADLNMDIYRFTPSGYLHHIKSYDEGAEQFRLSNFIAFKHMK